MYRKFIHGLSLLLYFTTHKNFCLVDFTIPNIGKLQMKGRL